MKPFSLKNFSNGMNSIYPVKSSKYIIRIIYPEPGLCIRIYFIFLFQLLNSTEPLKGQKRSTR